MLARSKEEVKAGAYLLHGFGFECSKETLIKTLQDGAKDDLWDQKILVEYSPVS